MTTYHLKVSLIYRVVSSKSHNNSNQSENKNLEVHDYPPKKKKKSGNYLIDNTSFPNQLDFKKLPSNQDITHNINGTNVFAPVTHYDNTCIFGNNLTESQTNRTQINYLQ